jgi:hypothetical protein
VPDYFEGVQFDRSEKTLERYFRAVTPNTGPYDAEVISSAVSALFDRIGDGVLVTHSQAGGPGWLTAIRNDNVRGIIAYEPGSGYGDNIPEEPTDAFGLDNWRVRLDMAELWVETIN